MPAGANVQGTDHAIETINGRRLSGGLAVQAQDVIEVGGDPPTDGGPANTGDRIAARERKRASVSATS